MKKLFGIVLMAALLLTMAPVAQAAGWNCRDQAVCETRNREQKAVCKTSCADCGKTFVDENQDGICDNLCKDCDKVFVDENQDGVCDNQCRDCGKTFVDADNNGVCDNRPQTCQPHHAAKATQGHHGQGHHGK